MSADFRIPSDLAVSAGTGTNWQCFLDRQCFLDKVWGAPPPVVHRG